MTGLKHSGMLMPSDETKQPQLPQHDWADKKLYQTPSAHRFMEKEETGVEIDGYDQLQTVHDTSVVTIRPKYYIGSSGSVWASDYMHIRYMRPDLYEIENEGDETSYRGRQGCAIISDTLSYYVMTTVKDDLFQMTKSTNCPHRTYEEEKIQWLKSCIEYAQAFVLSSDDDDDADEEVKQLQQAAQEILQVTQDISEAIQNKKSNAVVWKKVQELQSLNDNLPPHPQLKPYVIEYTDAGPGVASNNYEVKFREVEIAKLHKSSLRHRVHLASDDQGQNEAERTNAYIGEALADGTPLKIDYFDKHEGLTDDDKNSLPLPQLTAHEEKMAERNAWAIAEDIAMRIDSEPGPSGYMQGFVTHKKEYQFFYNTSHLNKWRKSGKRMRQKLPGHHYFSMIENIMKTHLEEGELYLEFSVCDSQTCTFCQDIPSIEPVPRPHPDTESGHYRTYENTLGYILDNESREQKRPVDEYQPRKMCKIMFEAGTLDPKNPDHIEEFCTKYLVKREHVLEHLNHIAWLQLKREKKKSEKDKKGKDDAGPQGDNVNENVSSDSDAQDTSGDDGNHLVLNAVDDSAESDDEDRLLFVPPVRTVTSRGRIAGTWSRNFTSGWESSEDESQSESSENEIDDEDVAVRLSDAKKSDKEIPNVFSFLEKTSRSGRTIKVPSKYLE